MNEGAALTEHTAAVQRRRSNIGEDAAAVRLEAARLSFGDRTLWEGLDLTVARGEFVAVLGPNGSGKTSLLKVLLGQVGLSSGTARIAGSPARTGNPDIGYVPQQKTIDAGVQLRGVDLVGLGVDGHRWGLGLRSRAERRRKVAAAVADVGAEHFAHAPLESMSGGEQQRLRVAQALVGDPKVLLCDEPLLSLDLANQRLVAELIDRRRRTHDTAVLFVTHEINPILPLVDRVLYLVDGRFRIGTPEEVMTSPVLSELYRTRVDVLRVRGRLVVVGTGDTMDALGTAGGHCHGPAGDEFAHGDTAPDAPAASSEANDPAKGHPASAESRQQADRSSTPGPVTNGVARAERIPAAGPAPAHPASGRSPNTEVLTGDSTSPDPGPGEPATNGSHSPSTTSGERLRTGVPSGSANDSTTVVDPATDGSASSRTVPGNDKSSVAAASAHHVQADRADGNGDRSAADPDESGVRS